MADALIGRRHELRAIERACERGARGVAVTGSAGVGKSRLATEVQHRLGDAGWRVVTIVGSHAARNIPMGPLASLLPNDPPANQALLLAHVLQNLVGDGDQRVLVSADDAHLLDDSTLALLVELVHRGDATVVLSIRTPEELPLTLARLLATDGIERVEVGPLPADDMAALAAEQLGGPLDETAVAEITDAARGNPLFLREVLADAVTSDVLVRDGDGWRLDAALRVGARLTELIQMRTSRLTADLCHVLEQIAIAEPIDVAIVDPTGEAMGELERHRLARFDKDADTWVARTDHPMVGEAIRNAMTTGDRLNRLRGLCDVVTNDGVMSAGSAARAAAWFRELGEELPAGISTVAAWEALVALDLDTAVALATPAAGSHWRAAFILAEIARSRADGHGAAGWYARAAELADDDAAIRRIAMAHSAVHAFQLTDPKAAIAALQQAAGRVDRDEDARELLCEAALMATLLGEFDDAVSTCRLVLAASDLDALTTWTAGLNFGYAQVMLGDVAGLPEALGRAHAVLPSIRREHPEGADLLTALTVGAVILTGDLDAAADLAIERLDELRRTGAHRGVAAAISTDALLFAGDRRALDVAFESVQQLRAYDPFNAFPYGVGYAALITALHGDIERAKDLLAEIDLTSIDVRSRAVVGRAEAAITAQDDVTRASAVALAAGLSAIEESHRSLGIFGLFDALGYGDATVAPILVDVCAGSSSPLIQTIAEHGAGVAADDVERSAAAAAALEAGGASFLATSAFTTTATMHTDPVAARRTAARATAAMLDAGPLSMVRAESAVDGALSRREVEVAVAAAGGQSNRDIADTLFVSARTVGNHLHRAYAKLDIEGRDELAAALSLPD